VLGDHPANPVGQRVVASRDAVEVADEVAVGVPLDEDGALAERTNQVERRRRERPPGEVAQEDDMVDVLAVELAEDGLERGRVAVDVGERGYPQRPATDPSLRARGT
jgi:hypothetical protein